MDKTRLSGAIRKRSALFVLCLDIFWLTALCSHNFWTKNGNRTATMISQMITGKILALSAEWDEPCRASHWADRISWPKDEREKQSFDSLRWSHQLTNQLDHLNLIITAIDGHFEWLELKRLQKDCLRFSRICWPFGVTICNFWGVAQNLMIVQSSHFRWSNNRTTLYWPQSACPRTIFWWLITLF